MKTTRPELGFERLLAALERDLLDANDEEISAVASELGIKPGMKGSIALFGITSTVRLRPISAAQLMKQSDDSQKKRSGNKARGSKKPSRRRPKGDAPSST
jgi:hypothetical protein